MKQIFLQRENIFFEHDKISEPPYLKEFLQLFQSLQNFDLEFKQKNSLTNFKNFVHKKIGFGWVHYGVSVGVRF